MSLIEPSGKKPEFINLYTSPEGKAPRACFTRQNQIVIICGQEGLIYETGDLLSPKATFQLTTPNDPAIDICAHGAKKFVILTEGGKLERFSWLQNYDAIP